MTYVNGGGVCCCCTDDDYNFYNNGDDDNEIGTYILEFNWSILLCSRPVLNLRLLDINQSYIQFSFLQGIQECG